LRPINQPTITDEVLCPEKVGLFTVYRVIVAPDHVHWHKHTLSRTPLDEGSTHHRDFDLTKYSTQKRMNSKPPSGFKPAIPTSEHTP
jgi:hypothetical protein